MVDRFSLPLSHRKHVKSNQNMFSGSVNLMLSNKLRFLKNHWTCSKIKQDKLENVLFHSEL